MPEYPQEGKKPGSIVVANEHLYFLDQEIAWKVAWNRVSKAELDFFRPSGLRAVMAGASAMMLQRVRNYLAITFSDDGGTEWTAKFQIHGALSIPGEEIKATEVLGYAIKFKKKFHQADGGGGQDVAAKIEQLAKLKEKGVLSEEEFNRKKADLLSRM